MTSNAIAYQKYLEDVRHNQEMEVQGRQSIEIGKANAETARQQVALGYSNLEELNRSNLANEAIKEQQVAVSQQQADIQGAQVQLQQQMAWPNLLAGIAGRVLPGVVGYTLGQRTSGSGGRGSQTIINSGWTLNVLNQNTSTNLALMDPFNF